MHRHSHLLHICIWIEDSLYAAKELQTREGFLWQGLCKSENIPIHLPLSINWQSHLLQLRPQQSSWAEVLFLSRILHTHNAQCFFR